MLQTLSRSPISFFFPFVFLLIININPLFAQEQLGMRLERYAGIYSAGINPANTAFTPHNWEVSLANADLFFDNSYAFLYQTSLPNALRNTDKIRSVADTSAENPPARDAILQDFFDGGRKMHFVQQARVGGPAFSFRFGGNNVIGLTTAIRNNISAYKIPEILAYRTVSDLPRNQIIDIPSTGISGMVWSEIGLHFSRLEDLGGVQMAWGVSPKYIMGYESFYTRAQSNFDYTQRTGDTVAFGSAKWDFAFTSGNATDNTDAIGLKRQGAGIGLDLGVSWAMPDDEEEGGYAWRAGVSLIDLGYARFRRSAQQHHIEFDTIISVSGANFPQRNSIDEVLQDVSQAFLGDSLASLQQRGFAMSLPTAFSAQFDARVAPMFYVSGLWVQRIAFSPRNIKRPTTIALVPRFEHRWASVSLPVVFNDWRSVRVGAALRLAWLYLGTDNLGSFFTKEKLTGTDVYIGLKINGFNLNFSKKEKGYRLHKERGSHSSGPNRKKIKCYSF